MHMPYQAHAMRAPGILCTHIACSSAWTCISSPMTHISPQPCPALHDTIISCVAKERVVCSRTQSQSTHPHTRRQHNLVAPNPRPRRTLNASKSPKAPSVSRSRWEIGSSPDRCGASSEAGVSWLVCQQSARQSAADLAQLCAEGRHVEVGEASGDVLGNVSLEQSRVLSEARRAEQVSGRVSNLQWSADGTGGAGGRAAVRGCGSVRGSLLDQLVLLALVKLATVLLHEAAYEVVEALVHHDVLEHRDHAFEGTRIDLAAENARRSSKAQRVREVGW